MRKPFGSRWRGCWWRRRFSIVSNSLLPAPNKVRFLTGNWPIGSVISCGRRSPMPSFDELRRQAVYVTQRSRLPKPGECCAMAAIRRLATEFACQWLHIRDFDHLDEKSERHFPTFVGLRGAMYEESIQFFTDLFQNDRPVTRHFRRRSHLLERGVGQALWHSGSERSPMASRRWREEICARRHSCAGHHAG